MGGMSIDSSSMRSYYRSRSSDWGSATNYSQVFKEEKIYPAFDPAVMKLPREACDSTESPRSRGIIFAEDVTGSMGDFIMSLITKEFPSLIRQTYEKVSYNPHICFMGVGDVAAGDEAPLQVTQFETDLRMLEQLEKIYIEGGGGGNNYESYILPWYFASKYVRMDCWEKRREKGFLFTFGDEQPTPKLTDRDLRNVFGSREAEARTFTNEECLKLASEKFNCYHIILHGWYYQNYRLNVIRGWKELMGTHAIDLEDHKYVPELVTTILSMYEGKSKTEAIDLIQSTEARNVVKMALAEHEEYVDSDSDNNTNNSEGIDLF